MGEEREGAMRYFDKSIGKNLTASVSCSGDWAEFNLGFYVSVKLRRDIVSNDMKEEGCFWTAGVNLLWFRMALSHLCFRKPTDWRKQ
jgi:hypothetical protein